MTSPSASRSWPSWPPPLSRASHPRLPNRDASRSRSSWLPRMAPRPYVLCVSRTGNPPHARQAASAPRTTSGEPIASRTSCTCLWPVAWVADRPFRPRTIAGRFGNPPRATMLTPPARFSTTARSGSSSRSPGRMAPRRWSSSRWHSSRVWRLWCQQGRTGLSRKRAIVLPRGKLPEPGQDRRELDELAALPALVGRERLADLGEPTPLVVGEGDLLHACGGLEFSFGTGLSSSAWSSFRCSLPLIAPAIITMRNRSVSGSIAGRLARSSPAFQVPYLLDFATELQRRFFGRCRIRLTLR